MAITVWPVDAKNGAPAYSGRKLRQTTVAPFLAGATSDRPLGGMTGVRPGTSPNTVTATGTTVTVRPFSGVVDAEAAAEASEYAFASDANVTFTSSNGFTPADSSNTRRDIVYVQINDPSESDGSTVPSMTVGYLAGTPSGTPALPATPARSFVIAQVTVPKSGGGTPSVTWVAPTLTAAGGVRTARTLTELQAFAQAEGSYADLRATTDAANWPVGLYRSNGTAWVSALTDTKWLPLPSQSSGYYYDADKVAQYRIKNGVLYLHGQLNRGSSSSPTNVMSSDVLCTFPSAMTPAQKKRNDVKGAAGTDLILAVLANGQVTFDRVQGTTTYVILDDVSWVLE